MSKLKVIPRPKKKDYYSQTWVTEWINSQKDGGESKMVSFDKKGYIEHLEKYANYLESLVKELENG